MKRSADNGPLDNSPSGDAIHPYDYSTSQNYTPDCPNCQRKMVITTEPSSPYKAFTCPDCSFKLDPVNRMEPGTGNSETGTEHIQNFEGLVEKAGRPVRNRPPLRAPENLRSDPMGHGVDLDLTKVRGFKADQPFPIMVRQEWDIKNKISELVYGMSYYQLTIGQKNRVDTAMRSFWDAHTLFASHESDEWAEMIVREAFMDRIAEPVEKKTSPAPAKSKGEGDKPISAWEMVKKRAQAINARVEKWRDALYEIDETLKAERARLEKEMKVPKLAESAAKALEWMKKLQASLKQKQFTLGKIAYKTAAAYKTNPESALKSAEALNAWLDKAAQVISPEKINEWEQLRTEAFTSGRDVPEEFGHSYTPDPSKRKPKELPPEEWQGIPPDKTVELLEPEKPMEPKSSSLVLVADNAWDTIKSWLNSIQSWVTRAVGLADEDQDLLDELAAEAE